MKLEERKTVILFYNHHNIAILLSPFMASFYRPSTFTDLFNP